MPIKRRTLFALGVALGLAMHSAPHMAMAEGAGTLRLGEQAKLITMDPHQHSGGGSGYLRPVYESLFDRDADNKVVPLLAESYAVDGNRIILTIKPGISFSDGEALSAEAVTANLNRVIEKGIQASMKLAEKAEVTGENEVTLTLQSPDPSIIDSLTGVAGMMISPKAMDDPALDRNPVGTGLYLYSPEESREGELRVYLPNPNYRDPDQVGLARLELYEIPDATAMVNALKTEQIDLAIFLSSPQAAIVDRSPGIQLIRRPGGTTYHLGIMDREGAKVPAFADKRVRMAMAHSINRAAFSKAVEFGLSTPAYQAYPVGTWAHNPAVGERYAYDLDKAKALMKEAGYEAGFEFDMPSIPVFASRLEAVAGFLKEINITMNIVTVEPGTLARRSMSQDFAATNLVWNAFLDPKFLTTYYVSEKALFNPYRIKPDPRLMELSAQGLNLVEPEDRRPVYDEMFKAVADDSFIIFITTTPILFGATDAFAANPTLRFRPGTDTPILHGLSIDG